MKGSTFDAALAMIDRFVVAEPERTGLSLTHPRLQDYLAREVFDASEQQDLLGRLIAWCDQWRKHHDWYAVVHGAAHKINAAIDLADLIAVGSELRATDYQDARVKEAGDAPGLFHDVDEVVAALSVHPDLTVDALVVAAVAAGDTRHRWFAPEPVFDLARQGALRQAVQRLGLLPGGQRWRDAAALVVAWVGATTKAKEAPRDRGRDRPHHPRTGASRAPVRAGGRGARRRARARPDVMAASARASEEKPADAGQRRAGAPGRIRRPRTGHPRTTTDARLH